MPTTIKTTPILVPEIHSFDEARQILQQKLNDLQQSILSQLPVTNMGGARVTSVGFPVAQDDAVNLHYLLSVINKR